MNTNLALRFSSPRRLAVVLFLVLCLVLVMTQLSAAAGGPAQWNKSGGGSGTARWQKIGQVPLGPAAQFADSSDWYVVSL